MTPQKLASMANQIASYFRSYPPDQAAAGIRDHLQKFWTPAMTSLLRAHQANVHLDPLAASSLQGWTDSPSPIAPSPIARGPANPARTGPLASDAG